MTSFFFLGGLCNDRTVVQEFLDTAGGHALPPATTSAIRALIEWQSTATVHVYGLGNAIWLLLAQHAHFQENRLVAGKSVPSHANRALARACHVRAIVLLTHPDLQEATDTHNDAKVALQLLTRQAEVWCPGYDYTFIQDAGARCAVTMALLLARRSEEMALSMT